MCWICQDLVPFWKWNKDMVDFENVTSTYPEDKIPVLRRISFRIEPGRFCLLTGQSGCGKTTLVRLLLRDLRPDEGIIRVNGRDIGGISQREIPFYRRGLGLVLQNGSLLHNKTVYENVALVKRIIGCGERDIRRQVTAALRMVGMEEKYGRYPQQLSAGERQKAEIARAIAGNPYLLVADEPTSGLDPQSAMEMTALLRRINAVLGTTVLIATNDLRVIQSIECQRLYMEKGRLREWEGASGRNYGAENGDKRTKG